MRVILDTNVLISGIAYPNSIPGKILASWKQGSLDVLLSDYILEELRRVLPRLAHRHHLKETEIDDLVDTLALQAEIVTPSPAFDDALRDVSDQAVLDILIESLNTSNADFLITGDKDLLLLAGRYCIVSPSDFWKAYGGF